MKYLLAGVAVAAALAIVAPVWAQSITPAEGAAGERTSTRTFMHQQVHNPTASSAAASPAAGAAGKRTSTRTFMHQQVRNPTASPAAASPAAGVAGKRTSTRRYMHHVVHRSRQEHGMSAAEQLNAQELQRIQAGAPPAPPPMTQ